MEIELMGRKIVRPVLVVAGLQHTEGILGYDTMHDEQIVVDCAADKLYFKETERAPSDWRAAPLLCRSRQVIQPRCVQHIAAIPVDRRRCLAEGATGLAMPLQSVGQFADSWRLQDAAAVVADDGTIPVAIVNASDRPVEIKDGTVLGTFFNPERNECTLEPLCDDSISSIFGEIGTDPKEPRRGRISDCEPSKEKKIRTTLDVKAHPAIRDRYFKLLLDYHDVISTDKFDLGCASVIKHKIVMKDNVPVHSRQFRIPFAHEQFIYDYVQELLKQGVIRESRSPYNSSIFCVAKKPPPNHKPGDPLPLRIILDYRQINSKSLLDRYSIKEVRQCLDEVGRDGSKIFTTIDLTAGFWQQELEETSRQYTAFTVPGLSAIYEWCVAPMGLQGSPASFSRLMNYVMRGCKGLITYVDDILCHSADHETHLEYLEQALLRLRKYNLKLNADKTIIAADEVTYLGYNLTGDGVSPSKDKLAAIRDVEPPKDVRGIREFVGLANYFRFLIPNFARRTAPLHALTKRSTAWSDGRLPPTALAAFEDVKKALIASPIVAFPSRDKTFVLQTDAAMGDKQRAGGLGAVLLQRDDEGAERVVAYASRGLKDHERAYPAFLLELAAACYGIDHFDTYLKGRSFILEVDHRPLEKLGSVHTKTLNRLQQLMLEHTFEVRYRRGEENSVADWLSRNAIVNSITDEPLEIRRLQRADKEIGDIARFLESGDLPASADSTKYTTWVCRMADLCCLDEHGLVWYTVQGKHREKLALYAPKECRNDILFAAHNRIDAGHGGIDRTVERIKSAYFWPGLTVAVRNFIANCATCQQFKAKPPAPAPLSPMPVPSAPGQRVHIDLFGSLRTSNAGNRWIVVMTDAYSKVVELAAAETKQAEVIARVFFERWLCRYTAPQVLVADGGTEFQNALMKEVCRLWGIERRKTSPFHPQTNSSAESFNRSLIKYMQALLDNTTTLDWERLLPPLQLAYNCHVHRSTGETPFFLTYLHDPRLPSFDLEKPRRLYGDNYVHVAHNNLQELYPSVKRQLEEKAEEMKARHDASAAERAFTSDDRVWVYFPNPPPNVNGKFYKRWIPYRVVKMVGNLNVMVKREDGKQKPMLVHINRCRKAAEDGRLPQAAQETELAYISYYEGVSRYADMREQQQQDQAARQEEEEEWSDLDRLFPPLPTASQASSDSSFASLPSTSSEEEEFDGGLLARAAATLFPQTRITRSHGPVQDHSLPNICPTWRRSKH